jgi:hypothetical protein
MIKSGYVGFMLFVGMMVVFFVLPDPKGLQKPFRVLLGLSFVIIYFALLIKKEISGKTLWPLVIGGALLVIMIFRGTFQTSLLNAYLCLFGLLCMPHLFFSLTPIRKINLNYIQVFCILSLLLQLMVYSSPDGRPSLSYQINFSGAYLFLFFISSDILKNKYGKLFVIAISLITLIRLLIYSIILFYLVKFLKIYFRSILQKLNATAILVASYIVLSLFSLWYVANIKSEISYDTSANRIATLNDESNQMRFLANVITIGMIYANPFDEKVLFGHGAVENFTKATKGTVVLPHNEIFDTIVEYGIILVIFFSIFTMFIFNKVISYKNMEYFIPLVFTSLLLYVRYFLIPNLEMLYIIFMLNIVQQQNRELVIP